MGMWDLQLYKISIRPDPYTALFDQIWMFCLNFCYLLIAQLKKV